MNDSLVIVVGLDGETSALVVQHNLLQASADNGESVSSI